jgi:hypothetical protein
MAKDIGAQIERIESAGAALGESASLLSDLVSAIDERLSNISGKVDATETGNGFDVTFTRAGNEWGLFLVTYDDAGVGTFIRMVSAPLVLKARAFPLVLKLLTTIEQAQRDILKDVQQALDAAQIQVKKDLEDLEDTRQKLIESLPAMPAKEGKQDAPF